MGTNLVNSRISSEKGKEKDKLSLQVDLTHASERLTEEYLDRYEGIKSKILNMTRFDENSDLSMTLFT